MEARPRHLTTSDGASVAYWAQPCAAAPARALICLHGAASNHTRWSEFVARTSLTERFSIFCPDMRGSGESRLYSKLGYESWCRDLAELLDAEGFESASLIGHSLGAQIAIRFAQDYPQRVDAIALVDPIVRAGLTGFKFWLAHFGGLFAGGAACVRLLNHLGLRRRNLPELDLRVLDEEARRMLAEPDGRERLIARYSSLFEILRTEPLAGYMDQAVATFARLPPLESVAAPVLTVTVDAVPFGDREAQLRELARFRDSESVSIDASHWPITEKPDEVRAAIEEWFARRAGE